MEEGPRAPIRDLIVDPEIFICDIGDDKVRLLYMELLMLKEKYERENVIMYLASNYSNNKHLSMTALRSMHDHEIQQILDETIERVRAEKEKRNI